MSPKHMIIRRGEFTGFRLPQLPGGRKDNFLPTHSRCKDDMRIPQPPKHKVRFKDYTSSDERWNGGDLGKKTYRDESGTARLLVRPNKRVKHA